ncbi:MAG: YceI family protein [Caldilineaceae bacterium]
MRYTITLLLVAMFLLAACDQSAEQAAQTAAATATTEAVPTVAVSLEEGMQSFTIVSEESSASYIAGESLFQGALDKYNLPIGNAVVTGTTDEVNGTLQLDLAAAELGDSQFTVNLVSLVTGQNDRDNWIRDNALESNTYPLAVFVPTEILNAPADYQQGQKPPSNWLAT